MRFLHLLLLASLLWLTGCATTQNQGHGPDNASDAQAQASAIPGGPLKPITPGQAHRSGVASLTPPADLWERIRRGFAMPDLQDDLVQEREQWYATRPDYILRMTQRSSKYLFHIVEELERRGMPTELALLPYIESAFNPQAVSSARAAGMWQFMPATGNYFDLKQNAFRDDRRDVLASTRAALDYLQKLYAMFGDWHLALAAYNWGEGSVSRAIARNQKQGLGTSYAELKMPAETRLYVPKLQAVKNIVADPNGFHAELPDIANHPYFQSVEIERDIDVDLVVKLASVDAKDFRALNPGYTKPVIFAAGTPQILLPWDNAQVFRRNLQAYDAGQYASWTVWTAPSTLSVAAAAKQVGMSEGTLRSLNDIPPRMMIKAGSALIVPRSSATQEDVAGRLADNGQIALTPEITTRRTLVRAGKHDSVASLAQRYQLSAASIADWNGIKPSASFKAGQQVVLHLPLRAASGHKGAGKGAGSSPCKKDKTSPAPQRRGGKPSKVQRR